MLSVTAGDAVEPAVAGGDEVELPQAASTPAATSEIATRTLWDVWRRTGPAGRRAASLITTRIVKVTYLNSKLTSLILATEYGAAVQPPEPASAPRRGPRPRISLGAVIRAAAELGIDSFNVLAVADRLGVSEGAVYRYVPSRERLQSLAADHVWANLATASEAATLGHYLRDVATRAAALADEHPGLATYISFGPYEAATIASFERLMSEIVRRCPQLTQGMAYVAISRVLHAALGYSASRHEAIRRANAPVLAWHLTTLIDGMTAAIDRGALPPDVDWAHIRAAVTLPSLDQRTSRPQRPT